MYDRHPLRRCDLYPLRFCNEAGERMTTRTAAETLLFADVVPMGNKTQMRPMGHKRHRVRTYRCDRCASWVEVHLQPVRLRCVRCGLEAKP